MSELQITAVLISTIVSLSGAIVFLYLRGEKTHRKYLDLMNQNLLNVTNAYVENAKAQEHLANAIDDLKLVVVSKRK